MNKIITNKDIGSLLYRVNQIACILMCMWIAIPYFRIRVGVIFLLFTFIIWLITTDLKWLIRQWTLDLVFLLIFFTTLIPYIIVGSLAYGIVNLSIFFVGLFINHYYMYYKEDYRMLGKIAFFSLLFFTVGSLQTYFGLLEYPMASRELAGAVANHPEVGRIYDNLGIGGFGHIYSASFLLVISLYLNFKKNNLLPIKLKVFSIITVVTMFLMILEASYATSLIIVFFGFFMVLIIRNKSILILLITIGFMFFLLFSSILISPFFLKLAEIFSGNAILYVKFIELSNIFKNGAIVGQTGDRIELYLMSFQTFLENPLFGIYGPFGNTANAAIGGHSGWFDLLAYYGVFTAVPLFLILYFNYRKHMKFYRKSNFYSYIIVIYLLFILFGIVNPILTVFEIGFVIFCVVPIIPFMPFAFKNQGIHPKLYQKVRTK
ncbi:hypothetical protein SAMN05421670_3069 [Psychrobacillus psychrotolerans]|uniref:O-Antigen ligase n=1 Tax=Psychrobacillus psychrotolerans TaxID=126156 RepID=A0A1I6A1T4_9BACI|nr:oligosaccharide repeat unit polymerase [Psychrobacillus psychrotolerans]SFQ62590.1 hypothetical protein SAMN05421670_3069 [Psychrobacillus psychrotolerans]